MSEHMTPTQTALALRAATLPDFQWMPGMQAIHDDRRFRVLRVYPHPDGEASITVVEGTVATYYRVQADGTWIQPQHGAGAVPERFCPDLNDAATGGALLTLLESAKQTWVTRSERGYQVTVNAGPGGIVAEGATLAEACARVADSIGRWPGRAHDTQGSR